MTMDIVIFEKGAAKVAVDAGDNTTQAQLRSDGWTPVNQQTTQRPEPFQDAVNQAAMATPPTMPTMPPAPDMATWHPDLPPRLVGNLAQRYKTPAEAAAASDSDLYQLGGMTSGHIAKIRGAARHSDAGMETGDTEQGNMTTGASGTQTGNSGTTGQGAL
jgi:hypothetical protein